MMIIPGLTTLIHPPDWTDRDRVEPFIAEIAPEAPRAVRNLVVALVTNPRMTSDHLLVVADGYAEGALETAFAGETARPLALSLHTLAKLLRERAAHHAREDRP
jgi:hypothetical protein